MKVRCGGMWYVAKVRVEVGWVLQMANELMPAQLAKQRVSSTSTLT
jgi:hypothetical protein